MTNAVSVTGKYNALTSLQKWLQTNVPGASAPTPFVWVFTGQAQTVPPPRIEVVEFAESSGGGGAFNDAIFPGGAALTPAQPTHGEAQAMRLQFDCYALESAGPNAKAVAYQLRDQVRYALRNAGVSDDNGNPPPFPPIKVLDYAGNLNSPNDTGILLLPDLTEAGSLERYYAPPVDQPGLHDYQLLIRFSWYEMTF